MNSIMEPSRDKKHIQSPLIPHPIARPEVAYEQGYNRGFRTGLILGGGGVILVWVFLTFW